jgi:hypothetical protein
MSISFKKLTYVIIILALFSSCKKEDEDLLSAIPTPGNNPPGNTDPVKPDPSDPTPPIPPTPIEGKKKVIIGNYYNPTDSKPRKDSKGYSQLGVWSQSSLKGFKNSVSRYSTDINASVTYETSKLGNAKYCVSVFKVKYSNSEKDTSVKLYDDGVELASKSFDYTTGGGWTHIGEYSFAGKKVSKVVISRGDNSNGGVLRADEVRFSKLKEGFDCFGKTYANIKNGAVLDNRYDPDVPKSKRDSAGYRESGLFLKSSLKGFKNSISRYSRDSNAFVTYTAKVQNSNYCLKVYRVTHPNSASEVKVSVSQGLQVLEEAFLDYSLVESEKGWVTIGNLNLDKSKPVVVKIEKNSTGSGVLRVDAIRFQKKSCK